MLADLLAISSSCSSRIPPLFSNSLNDRNLNVCLKAFIFSILLLVESSNPSSQLEDFAIDDASKKTH